MNLATGLSSASALALARAQRIYCANSSVTAPTAYTNAAVNGLLLWNGSQQGILAALLGVSIGWTTAPGATWLMGVTVGSGQTSAPTSTTGITGSGNLNPAGPPSQCTAYNAGTVSNAGAIFHATHSISVAADVPVVPAWVPLDGLIVIPPNCWAAVVGVAAIATMVAKISLVWAELE